MTKTDSRPLCIDCDGTLISTDLLHEAFFLMIKQFPKGLLLLPFWLLRGKAYLKERLAQHVKFNWVTLPYREDVLALIKVAKAQGRHIVLATASPAAWANGIADHLGVFDEVVATENGKNLSGKHKAQILVDAFGEKKFDYAGDSKVDLHVWKVSKEAIVIAKSKRLVNLAKQTHGVSTSTIHAAKANIFTYLRALRVHQWLKNLLIFVPLFAAHQAGNLQSLLQAAYAFIAFSACASSVYILNDLLDLESDRQHIRKRKRPFASSLIPLLHGALMIPLLLIIAFSISRLLPAAFILVLGLYFAATLAYSVRLKRQVIVDVMLLAGLYTTRVIAGAAATTITPSFWLLAFSMFIFLSLALIKRYSELLITLAQNKEEAAGRGYSVLDLPVLMSIGVSASMGAVMVFALYLNLPETNGMYPEKEWLWMMPPLLLYWLSRIWMKAHRGQVDDDPIIFAVKDWQSLVIMVVMAGLFWAALG